MPAVPVTPTPTTTGYTFGDIGGCNCSGLPPNPFPCSPCTLPLADMTVSWVNSLSGNGNAPLVWNGNSGTPGWTSACVGGIEYAFTCFTFRVNSFSGGGCTGTVSYCEYPGGPPNELTFVSHTCSPLSLTFDCTLGDCPVLAGGGFSSFTITYP
jgi:hypothetical protein